MKRFAELTEEEKDEWMCDDVMALYLREVSKRVNHTFYKTILRFIFLYRECLNEYGWLKRRENYEKAQMLDEDHILARLKEREIENAKAEGENMDEEDEIFIP